jgi:hypothetical protein
MSCVNQSPCHRSSGPALRCAGDLGPILHASDERRDGAGRGDGFLMRGVKEWL